MGLYTMKWNSICKKITPQNSKKAIRYLKKNGLPSTYYAIKERLLRKETPYVFVDVSQQEYSRQCNTIFEYEPLISILVPAYETKPEHLRQMIQSVIVQSYGKWELILADASSSKKVEEVVREYEDPRIRYYPVIENRGIAENTNVALSYATGDYCSLLDHDDVITKDALYEVVEDINGYLECSILLEMIYSDEDKCDEDMEQFYEPHIKPDFNYDLFLSNNYICHFATIRTETLRKLEFRGEYNGAQDYDVFLRVVSSVTQNEIAHIPKILYHWRCHSDSTAVNPDSKIYAYEAGKCAIEDFLTQQKICARVEHTRHLGFYRIEYREDLFEQRKDLVAVGGFTYKKNKIVSGAYDTNHKVMYEGLPKYYSGYMNRAMLQQNVFALDIRTMRLCEEYEPIYEEILEEYEVKKEELHFESEDRIKEISIAFGLEILKKTYGKEFLLDPLWKG